MRSVVEPDQKENKMNKLQSDKRVSELKKLTDDLEIQGSAQDNAIYELAHGISEVETSIQRELELFKHQFDEAKTRFEENGKRVYLPVNFGSVITLNRCAKTTIKCKMKLSGSNEKKNAWPK